MKIELKIIIDGKEYTKDEALKLYKALKDIFEEPTIFQYPKVFDSPLSYGPSYNPTISEPYGPMVSC